MSDSFSTLLHFVKGLCYSELSVSRLFSFLDSMSPSDLSLYNFITNQGGFAILLGWSFLLRKKSVFVPGCQILSKEIFQSLLLTWGNEIKSNILLLWQKCIYFINLYLICHFSWSAPGEGLFVLFSFMYCSPSRQVTPPAAPFRATEVQVPTKALKEITS